MSRWTWGVLCMPISLLVGCVETPPSTSIPPIDAAAPAKTETATLALG